MVRPNWRDWGNPEVRLFTLGFKGAKEEWLIRLAEENYGAYHRIK